MNDSDAMPGASAPSMTLRAGTATVATLVLIVVYVALAILPLILAAASGVGGRPGLRELGSSIAMVGFAALLLEFVLSGRFRLLTDPVGMDAVMRFHQFSGHVVLALLLVHPYLYALMPAEIGPVGARIATATGGGTLGAVTGFLAWFGLIALVFAAIFRNDLPMTYETWRLTHGLGSAAVAVLGLVHTVDAGAAAAAPVVRTFWIVAVGLALLTLVRVYAIGPWLKSRRPWRVGRVTRLAANVHELEIEPDGHAGLDFRAGQFAWLRIAPSAWGVREHPFSIASAPGDGTALRFLVKANGDYTGRIGEVEPGARAWIDGPYGHFGGTGGDAGALVLVAGGVGLAPILGLLRDLRNRGDRRPLRLIYACRWSGDMVLQQELAQLETELDLQVVRVVDAADRPPGTSPGPVDQALLEQSLPPVERTRVACFICAPPGMIDAMETALTDLGIPQRRIVSERFRYRYGAGSPIARRIRRSYAAVAAVLVLAAVVFAASR